MSEAVDYCISTGRYNESERGMEAIRRVEVENFPPLRIIGGKRNDFFKESNLG